MWHDYYAQHFIKTKLSYIIIVCKPSVVDQVGVKGVTDELSGNDSICPMALFHLLLSGAEVFTLQMRLDTNLVVFSNFSF
jgi:hypothetical protein